MYKYIGLIKGRPGKVLTVLGLGILMAAVGYNLDYQDNRHIKKVKLIFEYGQDVFNREAINYGAIDRGAGAEDNLSSGLWRLDHWTKIIDSYREGDIYEIFFGRGLGSTNKRFISVPHNEYLRMLYEMGLTGLTAYLVFWIYLFSKCAPGKRWLILAFMIYSFTENNLDNQLFIFGYMAIMLGNIGGRNRTGIARA